MLRQQGTVAGFEFFLGDSTNPPVLSVRNYSGSAGAKIDCRNGADTTAIGFNYTDATKPRMQMEDSSPSDGYMGIFHPRATGYLAFGSGGVDNNLRLGTTGLLIFGGTETTLLTTAFPGLRRTSARLDCVLADNSTFADFKASLITCNAGFDVNGNDVQKIGALTFGGDNDAAVRRLAADQLSLIRSTNACAWYIYRTASGLPGSDYERMALQSGAGYFEVAAETAGAGTDNIDVRLTPAGTGIVRSAAAIKSVSATGGIGYATGAGGTVAQATDRTTGVTLNTVTGQITTQATSLAGLAIVTFTVTNSAVAAADNVIPTKVSGDVDTFCWVDAIGAGSFNVTLRNSHAVNADTTAFVFNFAVIKGVTS